MLTQKFTSEIVQKGRLLSGVHGLRGIAAMAVVLYHLNHLVGIAPPPLFKFIGRDFGFSVHLFFILSAFTLYYSTESRTNNDNWLSAYFVKRFFRIAPLYYFMIAFELSRQIVSAGKIVTDSSNIILNLTFTFGLVPFSGFIWAGWAVGVEMIFYVIFPVLILTIRTHRSALLFLGISIAVSYYIRSALHAQHLTLTPQPKWDWSYFAFASNLCYFAMGIYAFHVRRLCTELPLPIKIVPFIAVIIIGGLAFSDAGKFLYGSGRWDIIIWGFGLMALCIWQSVSPSALIANKLFEYLGERSFSIYLLHPVIIFFSKAPLLKIYQDLNPHIGANAFFVCAILVITLVLMLAECTYRFIEVPGIRLGRKLINKKTS